MKEIFVDLHIHIGCTPQGRPVKITASRGLTLPAILTTAPVKGVQVVGVVDTAVPAVLEEIDQLLRREELVEAEGCLMHPSTQTYLVMAAEVEVPVGQGLAHFLAYLPGYRAMQAFSRWLEERVGNVHLSTPRLRAPVQQLFAVAADLGGWVAPAHIFTPYKGLLGACGADFDSLLGPAALQCFAVELGLSSDTGLAMRLPQIAEQTFLTASDAHSLAKIAREAMRVRVQAISFQELRWALEGQQSRGIVANYGLDPRLGKYYRTFCQVCQQALPDPPPVLTCPHDENHPVVMGVLDRIHLLERVAGKAQGNLRTRPPYVHQIPLEFIPGIGPRTRQRLVEELGSELAVLHLASRRQLVDCVGERLADRIEQARRGEVHLRPGGGGLYGRWL